MSLFHSPEFCDLNGLPILRDEDTGASLLIGPERGSYGGFAGFADAYTMEKLLRLAPPRCAIKLAPADYDIERFSRSMNTLHKAGFLVDAADLSYVLRPLDINFTNGMSTGAAKKLAKGERARFVSHKLERADWRRAHALLHANRVRQGYAPPIPLSSIEAVERALPGTYHFFATHAAGKMIAAAITVKVEDDILYIYSWGDAEKNEDSPTTHLFSAIYEEACFMSCRLLDAGTCVANGAFNEGIADFKESLGFRPSVKITMARK